MTKITKNEMASIVPYICKTRPSPLERVLNLGKCCGHILALLYWSLYKIF